MRNKQSITSPESWDMIIKPKTGWLDIDVREVWRYRDLIGLFVKRDFVAYYKQTILGPLWYLLQPLLTTIVFTVIFGKFAKIPTDGMPPFLFYLAGNVVWGYFSNTLNATSNTFISNKNMFGKVYFPRLAVPISVTISNLVQFSIQFCLFLVFYFYFYFKGVSLHPSIWILILPLLVIQMAVLSLGVGILISSMTTKYKDLRFAMGFLTQLWMYATPIVYPLSQVPEKLRSIYILNPMVAIVESFKFVFLGSGSIRNSDILLSWIVTLIVLLGGLILFSRIEKTFMDTV